MNKIPPQDLDLEKTVLGSILIEPEVYSENSHLLFSDLWYSDSNRIIYEAMKSLTNSNQPIDLSTIFNKLKTNGTLEQVGGAYYVTQLTNAVVATSRIDYHIRILTELYIKRKMINLGVTFQNEAYDLSKDIFESMNVVENKLEEINSHIIGNDSDDSFESGMEKTFKYITTPRETRHTGIRTGNPKLNDILGGWNKGEFIIIGARPSMGKTTRMLQFVMEALDQNEPVCVFSMEMVREHQLNTKLLNYVSGISSGTIRTQSWNDEELNMLTHAKNKLSKMPLYINDKSGINPNYVRSVCRQRKKKYGLGLIAIDYLQLMSPNETVKGRSRTGDIGSISRALKSISKDLQVPVIALSQLSRECEDRRNIRPMLRDLREAGDIEQDADVVLSLYRPAYYYAHDKDRDYKDKVSEEDYEKICELGVLKNRMGAANLRIIEYFDKSISRFTYDNDNAVNTVPETTENPF